MSRKKVWCFTLNNYNEGDVENFQAWDEVRYLVIGKEIGENGTPHLQGYVELNRALTMAHLKAFNQRVHWEPRRGSAKQASDYCKKDGDYIEVGEISQAGARTDISAIKTRIKNKESLVTILEDCTNFQQMKCAQLLAGLQPLSHAYAPKEVHWFYGSTGTGKTRTAMEACPEGNTWHSNGTGQWFDGYYGQEYVIFDEFRAKNYSYDLMLKLLDGYELQLPIKGGFTVWKPKVIYITAPLPPASIYAGQLEYHGSIEQLLRRITDLKNFDNVEIEPMEEPRIGVRVVEHHDD